MSVRINEKIIDRAALLAVIVLLLGQSFLVGAEPTPSTGWAWLGVGVIAVGANAARLRVGARPSERGVALGVVACTIALLRLTGIIAEVTPALAALAVLAAMILPVVLRVGSRAR